MDKKNEVPEKLVNVIRLCIKKQSIEKKLTGVDSFSVVSGI